jgi:hypothetical protein
MPYSTEEVHRLPTLLPWLTLRTVQYSASFALPQRDGALTVRVPRVAFPAGWHGGNRVIVIPYQTENSTLYGVQSSAGGES